MGRMSLNASQKDGLEKLLIKYTHFSPNTVMYTNYRKDVIDNIDSVLCGAEKKVRLDLNKNDILPDKSCTDFFTDVIRVCFPGQKFTCQAHEDGSRDIRRAVDTKDYSGAVAYVFALPDQTIRFFTRLWRRGPEWVVVHQFWMAQDVECDTDSDTDLEGRFIDILNTLHARVSALEQIFPQC